LDEGSVGHPCNVYVDADPGLKVALDHSGGVLKPVAVNIVPLNNAVIFAGGEAGSEVCDGADVNVEALCVDSQTLSLVKVFALLSPGVW
jgi:hypothetical protein